jgi:hypothetical protein
VVNEGTMNRDRPFLVTCLSLLLVILSLGFPIFLLTPSSQAPVDFLKSMCGVTAFLAKHYGAQAVAVEGALVCLWGGITGVGLWRLRLWARASVIVWSSSDICLTLG